MQRPQQAKFLCRRLRRFPSLPPERIMEVQQIQQFARNQRLSALLKQSTDLPARPARPRKVVTKELRGREVTQLDR
jgi:hypothetical protein